MAVLARVRAAVADWVRDARSKALLENRRRNGMTPLFNDPIVRGLAILVLLVALAWMGRCAWDGRNGTESGNRAVYDPTSGTDVNKRIR